MEGILNEKEVQRINTMSTNAFMFLALINRMSLRKTLKYHSNRNLPVFERNRIHIFLQNVSQAWLTSNQSLFCDHNAVASTLLHSCPRTVCHIFHSYMSPLTDIKSLFQYKVMVDWSEEENKPK